MQRILNDPDNIVDEMLEGFLDAHVDIVERTGNPRVVESEKYPQGKDGRQSQAEDPDISLLLSVYVGKICAMRQPLGEIYSSPTAAAFLDACREADQGKGVACLYGNYSGDNMNVKNGS